jgi:hypothetical protein
MIGETPSSTDKGLIYHVNSTCTYKNKSFSAQIPICRDNLLYLSGKTYILYFGTF